MSEPRGELAQPDFDALGRESLWPADEWRAAWNGIPAPADRAALWPAIVVLGSGYTRPTRAADALAQAALFAGLEGDQ